MKLELELNLEIGQWYSNEFLKNELINTFLKNKIYKEVKVSDIELFYKVRKLSKRIGGVVKSGYLIESLW